jgi:hypothetical protein
MVAPVLAFAIISSFDDPMIGSHGMINTLMILTHKKRIRHTINPLLLLT